MRDVDAWRGIEDARAIWLGRFLGLADSLDGLGPDTVFERLRELRDGYDAEVTLLEKLNADNKPE